MSKISLAVPPWGKEEIAEAKASLDSGMLTMGEKCRLFEELWADHVGVKHGVMVNSGSSALELAFQAIKRHKDLNIDDKPFVLTSALTWSTTISSMIRAGFVPWFVDINLDTLTINTERIKAELEREDESISGIVPVHLLGTPVDMAEIHKIKHKNKLWVIEDCCEAHGANVGSIGDISVWSFFMSHHISTIEGGMVCTDNSEIADIVKMMRAHGWIRELEDNKRRKLEILRPEIDSRFFFAELGYNLRPTEIQGAFGIHQVKKLDWFVQSRRANAKYLRSEISKFGQYYVPRYNPESSYLLFPILISQGLNKSNKDLIKHLHKHNIESRPIMTGDVREQLMMADRATTLETLSNTKYVHEKGVLIPVHQGLTEADLDTMISVLKSFGSI